MFAKWKSDGLQNRYASVRFRHMPPMKKRKEFTAIVIDDFNPELLDMNASVNMDVADIKMQLEMVLANWVIDRDNGNTNKTLETKRVTHARTVMRRTNQWRELMMSFPLSTGLPLAERERQIVITDEIMAMVHKYIYNKTTQDIIDGNERIKS